MALPPFFVKPLPLVITGVGNERAANPAVHLNEYQYPAMTWRSNGAASLTMDIDLGAATPVDFFAVLGANALPATNWLVKMGASAGAAAGGSPSYSSGVLPFVVPAVAGRALYHSHHEAPALQSYRYVNLSILDHAGDFEAMFLVIGKKITVARYYEPQWENGPVDRSSIGVGRTGVPEIARGRVDRARNFTLGWITEAEYELQVMPLLMACGKTEPLLCAFDPDPTIYRQGRVDFGRLAESKVRKRAFNAFEKEFDIESMI